MKIDRPFDHLREIFQTSNVENKELLKYVFDKSDSISLWIIGLSVGGISIFANNIADIQKVISPDLLRPILFLLAISVSSGIIYRALYLYFFVILSNILQAIGIALSNKKTMDTESYLTGKETFKQLIDLVAEGAGDDLSYLIPAYEKIDATGKAEVYKSVVDHYENSVKFARIDTDITLEFVAETYSSFFGKKKEKVLKSLTKGNTAVKYKVTLVLTSIFYLIYLLSFIGALFTFVYSTQ